MSDQATVTVLPDCDFCKERGVTRSARYDGKTRMGPWAMMCASHFDRYGVGLGTGRGQRLVCPAIDSTDGLNSADGVGDDFQIRLSPDLDRGQDTIILGRWVVK